MELIIVHNICYDESWKTCVDGHMEKKNEKVNSFLLWNDETFEQFITRLCQVLK